ncbi:hypothetical protein MMC13_002960 [Lambiella insularis]|nr:hypothetical protein [Lambiella insularis]
MSLTSAYDAFLAFPSPSHLSEDASLNYITTLTTIKGSAEIAKHTSQQQLIVKKKLEKLLSSIEGDNALCVEVETTLEFLTGGGAFVPGLDDSFIAGHVVTLPFVHIVNFNNDRQIQQIRMYWDQGSLLKLVDVIGSRAMHWPIRDGKEQIRLIASSAANASKTKGTLTSTTRQMADATLTSKAPSPRKNVAGDTHPGLSIFDHEEVNRETTYAQNVAPRASAKPPPREYNDLFMSDDGESSQASKARPASPTKGGGGKNFQPSRLFDTEEPEDSIGSGPQKGAKANPDKYDHFEFADGSDESQQQQSFKPRPNGKHQAQWNFSDFSTPEKLPRKVRPQDVRHYGWGDDAENHESPDKNNRAVQPRRDAEVQIELKDDGTPVERRPGPPRGQASNKGLGLYKNNMYGDIDSSPGLGEKSASQNNRPIPENRNKAVKMMEAQWETTDASPKMAAKSQGPGSPSKTSSNNKENVKVGRNQALSTGIKTAGDSMGGRKGTGRTWGFGEESDEDGEGGLNAGKFMAGKKQQAPKETSFWDF